MPAGHRGNYILVSVTRETQMGEPLQLDSDWGKARARTVARRGLRMANTADHRGRSFEKLRPVTAGA